MRLLLLLPLTAFVMLTSCKEEQKKTPAKKSTKEEKIGAKLSKAIEAFTGARTRIVWSEYNREGGGDTFATSDGLLLKGLDTQEGTGERRILPKSGNYSRPLLTCDGTGIIYTDKNTVRKGGMKHYKPLIYLTGWKGGKPIRLGEGYAVDCWRDPTTGVEFVYAVQKLKSSKALALEGEKLVRFPLNEPEKVEVVYDQTHITPDNVQLSRDGTRACGLFPWPHAGFLRFADGQSTVTKIGVGCWTSMAPDNSGLSWAFDGEHKSVVMFANDGAQTWPLKFNTVPGAKSSELYHPRWSNHPRFIVLTGPYKKQKDYSGSVINKGGYSAQVFMGRLSEDAKTVEAWTQISYDNAGESYPDAWIEGADNANLKGFSIPQGTPDLASKTNAWPAQREGLLFLWQDRAALNAFTARDGKKHEGIIASRGAGRYGRYQEMLLDGGGYEVENESAVAAAKHLEQKLDASFEALVLPANGDGTIFTAPAFSLGLRQGKLVVTLPQEAAWESSAVAPQKPFHLVVNRRADDGQWAVEVYVDGEPLSMSPGSSLPGGKGTAPIIFGGGWNGGLLQVALHDRALPIEDVTASYQAAQSRMAAFPAQPPRVRLQGKLAEASAMPTAEGIAPYTSSLVSYVYEVEKVLEGELKASQVLVKHWCMLDQQVVQGFPRQVGQSYELILERQADHSHLNGERVMDDTTAFDLEAWFDVSPPRVTPQAE